MPARPHTSPWKHRFNLGREVGAIFWGMLFLEASFGAYMGIWPIWIERLGAPIPIVGLVLGSSGLLRLAALGPSAILADRIDPRLLVLLARGVAGIGFLTAAIATHWTHLFLMVIGSAVGELAFPLIQSHVAAHAGDARVRAFTLVFTVGPSVALGLGPLITGALVAIWGIRAAFVFAAVCTVISIGFFSRMSGRSQTVHDAATRPTSTYREAFADTAVRRTLILQGSTIFTLALGTSLVPTFLEDVRGFSAARITTLGAAAAVGSILFGLTVARVTRLQQAPFVGIAIAVGAVIAALGIFVGTSAMPLIMVAFVLRGGFIAAWSLYAATIGNIATERHRARSFALSEMIGGMGFSFAPMLAGWLYTVRASLPMLAAACCSALLFVGLARAHRGTRSSRDEQSATAVVPASDPVTLAEPT